MYHGRSPRASRPGLKVPMRVLVADAFEESRADGPEGRRLRRPVSARPQGRGAGRRDPHVGGRGARRPVDQGHRGDARRRAPGAGRPRRRRLQHHRRQGRVGARHLRLELPRQERDGRRRADLRAAARHRSPRRRQRRRSARRHLEQEALRQGERAGRQDARRRRRRRHRPRGDSPGPRLRHAGGAVEPALRRGGRHADRAKSRTAMGFGDGERDMCADPGADARRPRGPQRRAVAAPGACRRRRSRSSGRRCWRG